MARILLLIAGLGLIGAAAYWFLAAPSAAEICPLDDSRTAPSGRTLDLCDVVYEIQPNNDVWAVVRVLDAGLQANAGQDDHDWVCETWGLAAMEKEPRPTRVVVQIMAEPFVRGEPAPGITQAIEAYSAPGDTCQWELL
ncbi:DUF6497 family protein [Gymnodinialimonas hymeniacidonis]|uniref:DUF6497 family protein n=1 Tax=Gymnodinialimonas hymeniacidonis TaxID=3126508 RepID=UPI0034C6608F